jgi:hypothetical protein
LALGSTADVATVLHVGNPKILAVKCSYPNGLTCVGGTEKQIPSVQLLSYPKYFAADLRDYAARWAHMASACSGCTMCRPVEPKNGWQKQSLPEGGVIVASGTIAQRL